MLLGGIIILATTKTQKFKEFLENQSDNNKLKYLKTLTSFTSSTCIGFGAMHIACNFTSHTSDNKKSFKIILSALLGGFINGVYDYFRNNNTYFLESMAITSITTGAFLFLNNPRINPPNIQPAEKEPVGVLEHHSEKESLNSINNTLQIFGLFNQDYAEINDIYEKKNEELCSNSYECDPVDIEGLIQFLKKNAQKRKLTEVKEIKIHPQQWHYSFREAMTMIKENTPDNNEFQPIHRAKNLKELLKEINKIIISETNSENHINMFNLYFELFSLLKRLLMDNTDFKHYYLSHCKNHHKKIILLNNHFSNINLLKLLAIFMKWIYQNEYNEYHNDILGNIKQYINIANLAYEINKFQKRNNIIQNHPSESSFDDNVGIKNTIYYESIMHLIDLAKAEIKKMCILKIMN